MPGASLLITHYRPHTRLNTKNKKAIFLGEEDRLKWTISLVDIRRQRNQSPVLGKLLAKVTHYIQKSLNWFAWICTFWTRSFHLSVMITFASNFPNTINHTLGSCLSGASQPRLMPRYAIYCRQSKHCTIWFENRATWDMVIWNHKWTTKLKVLRPIKWLLETKAVASMFAPGPQGTYRAFCNTAPTLWNSRSVQPEIHWDLQADTVHCM